MICPYCHQLSLQRGICTECRCILPMQSTDYFALFSLPQDFDISLAELDKAYFALQIQLHPDKFISRSDADPTIAAANSATLNTAYNTLKNDLTRAEHILLLNNIDLSSTAPMELDSAFLNTAFEWREKLMDLDASGKLSLKADITSLRASLFHDFRVHIQQANFIVAAQALQKVRFTDRFLNELQSMTL